MGICCAVRSEALTILTIDAYWPSLLTTRNMEVLKLRAQDELTKLIARRKSGRTQTAATMLYIVADTAAHHSKGIHLVILELEVVRLKDFMAPRI